MAKTPPTDQCENCHIGPVDEEYTCFIQGVEVAGHKTCEGPLPLDHAIYDMLSGIHEEKEGGE